MSRGNANSRWRTSWADSPPVASAGVDLVVFAHVSETLSGSPLWSFVWPSTSTLPDHTPYLRSGRSLVAAFLAPVAIEDSRRNRLLTSGQGEVHDEFPQGLHRRYRSYSVSFIVVLDVTLKGKSWFPFSSGLGLNAICQVFQNDWDKHRTIIDYESIPGIY